MLSFTSKSQVVYNFSKDNNQQSESELLDRKKKIRSLWRKLSNVI